MKRHTKRCRGASSGKRYMRVADPVPRDAALTWSQCLTCGAWLPLGSSDEEHVRVEVRAADLADAGFGDLRPVAKLREEVDGLICYERDRDGTLTDRPMWDAGWLCGAIIFHNQEQRS